MDIVDLAVEITIAGIILSVAFLEVLPAILSA